MGKGEIFKYFYMDVPPMGGGARVGGGAALTFVRPCLFIGSLKSLLIFVHVA